MALLVVASISLAQVCLLGVAVCGGMGYICRHACNEAAGMMVQIAKLQQQVKTLERENGMLRQIIKNIQNPGDRSVPEAP